MSVDFTRLHGLRLTLQRRDQALAEEEAAAKRRRQTLLVAGRQAASITQQRILARQVQTVHHELAGLDRRRALIGRQLLLVNQVLWLRESAALREAARANGLLEKLNWPAILRDIEAAQTREGVELAHLSAMQALMERALMEQALPPVRYRPAAEIAGLVRVERVIDGDTIVIAGGERVRYIGMDAPEMHDWSGAPEAFAREAHRRNEQLVAGRLVRLEKERSERDRFGRLLRHVYAGDRLVGAQLVREGLAYALPMSPDTRRASLFARLEEEARCSRRGLWRAALGD